MMTHLPVSDSQDPIWAILQHAPSMLGYFDRDLQCRFANRACEQWFCAEPSELIGSALRDIVGKESFDANRHYIDAVLAGTHQSFELSHKAATGTAQLRVSGRPHIVAGKVIGFVIEVNDVTALHEAQKALRSEMALREHAFHIVRARELALRQAQRLANIGSWEWESGPDIVRWSEQLYDMFGLDLQRLPPSFLHQRKLYSAESWVRLQDACARSLSTGQPYVLELQYFHSSGRHGWIESRGQVDRDEHGSIVGMHGTAMEITARRLTRNADVEHAAATRLQAELSLERARAATLEEQLAQSRKLEVVGLLASGIAHDFNNVLAAVSGALHVLELRTRDQRDSEFIARGQHGVERATRLVRQLMGFSRSQVLQSRTIDLGATLESCGELLKLSAGPRAKIHLDTVPGLAASLDPNQLEVALLNLVINARDAMPQGGEVFIGVARASLSQVLSDPSADVRWAALTVRDTGSGMLPAVLARAREPFFTTKSFGEGTGLGLAMVGAFAQRCGGSMAIASEPGQGTTVTVLLPLADPQIDAPSLPETMQVELGPHGHARVLVVEDDPLVRPVVSQYLRELGYTVVEADNAEHALQLADGIDLVVTDLAMPGAGGDGANLAAQLQVSHPQVPILMMTGQVETENPTDRQVLVKPFTLAQLSEAVLRLLGRAALPRLRPIADRIKHPALLALYETWVHAKPDTALPSVEALALDRCEAPGNVFVAEITCVQPFAYERTFTGNVLADQLKLGRAQGWLDEGEQDALSELEAAYQRCFSLGAPIYEYIRFRAIEGENAMFERLLLPCADPVLQSHRLVGMVFFEHRRIDRPALDPPALDPPAIDSPAIDSP